VATYDHTEQEQLDELKDWWKRYGKATIITVIIATCLGFGWRYWNHLQEQSLEEASQTYEALLASVDSQRSIDIDQRANDLIDKHPKTDYAEMAALFLAKQAILNGDLSTAATKLRWVIETAKLPSTRQVARVRLARVLLADKKIDDAFSVLEKVDDVTWVPMIQAVKGDLYAATQKIAEARQAYQQALKDLPKTDPLIPVLQMKLENL
jgi:predicted negative regulator of RcsB-dependent stress response